ncbi:hypothetical protein [Stenotrophomonas maltophilia]|uniref:hypothetical protein n=1 Tax=Stenotrophomonas maltophilia TaxID=40324 RepID=UPI001952EF70|nr:hypothetical protein [Stenotrophomonas maltophilia]
MAAAFMPATAILEVGSRGRARKAQGGKRHAAEEERWIGTQAGNRHVQPEILGTEHGLYHSPPFVVDVQSSARFAPETGLARYAMRGPSVAVLVHGSSV